MLRHALFCQLEVGPKKKKKKLDDSVAHSHIMDRQLLTNKMDSVANNTLVVDMQRKSASKFCHLNIFFNGGGVEKHCRKQRKLWAAADEPIYLFFIPVLFLSQLKASNAVF